MFTRSLFTTTLASTLLACSLFACSSSDDGSTAAPAADEVGDDANAETGESELRADSYVGKWNADGSSALFSSLTIKKGGWYEASFAPACAPGLACPEVLRVESGRYSIVRSGTKQTLRLVPRGAAVRRYQISFAATVAVVGAPRAIELSRSGKSQVLLEEGASSGEACGKGTCAPGLVCCNALDAICTLPGEFCTQ